ncbi:putative ribosomal Rna large subunit methyltransferase FTSJ1 [Cardiosporidium cionae]|uniref:Putative tRNA (cytidine(32)/guanosine(34)-2'-O)-methyltransferase n=1 Tax=Cardiosporidium cionae TaxID=476202 RepID=A0ABQ7JAL1_9APIC|nr:putative ribosomal Rna large subunit methyltransferase FTSJ1 [Cardiosporidium cionae]|eukprot:KAF8821026.1 putative ribosomal Rna large subunit methyltransferase FTSJ1 [Cardiosporidium cionae]
MGKLSKDRRDIYYRRAKEQGYRARSAYKLIQLNEQFNFFSGVSRVVDLCAAPGSWSQVVRNHLWSTYRDSATKAPAIATLNQYNLPDCKNDPEVIFHRATQVQDENSIKIEMDDHHCVAGSDEGHSSSSLSLNSLHTFDSRFRNLSFLSTEDPNEGKKQHSSVTAEPRQFNVEKFTSHMLDHANLRVTQSCNDATHAAISSDPLHKISEMEGMSKRKGYSTAQERSEAASKPVEIPLIVAVDLQEMAPIEGIITLQGDITSSETLRTILQHFNGQLAHLIICDGAPDVTGLHDIDEYVQSQLLLAALKVVIQLLVPGGTFVAKVFRGENISLLYSQLLLFFEDVFCCKPASSRNSSLEAFVVCQKFGVPIDRPFPLYPTGRLSSETHASTLLMDVRRCFETQVDPSNFPEDFFESPHSKEELDAYHFMKCAVPFMACGDLHGFDADRNYALDLSHELKGPVQPPIHAPYERAVEERRGVSFNNRE